MNRCRLPAVCVTSTLLGLILSNAALAQHAQDIVGTYALVSVSNVRGDSKTEPYGPDPKGILRLDESGRYVAVLMRLGLPKFASNNRTTGTAEEYKAVALGSFIHLGTYTVADGHIIFRLENSSYPNWDGETQKRKLTVTESELKYEVSSTIGGTSTVVWKRIR
jgi:hypothetical protein